MKLRTKLKIVGALTALTGLSALTLNDNPDYWTVIAKTHELARTYPEYDFWSAVYTGRTMLDDEDFKIKLLKIRYAMGRVPIAMYSEREVCVSREVYDSIILGDSGVIALRNEITDEDFPAKSQGK